MVKCGNDFKRTFIGQIYKETTTEGKTIVRGIVVVNEGKIWSSAETQDELVKNLDYKCFLSVDCGLHSNSGAAIKILDDDFFLN